MQIRLQPHHLQQAVSLYEYRQALLTESCFLRQELTDCEDRLRIHLLMLATDLSYLDLQPCEASTAFVSLASLILAEQEQDVEQLANTWFINEALKPGVIAALCFCPPRDNADFLLKLFYVHPSLRVDILQLWGAVGHEIPQQVLQTSLTAPEPQLRLAALQVAIWQQQIKVTDLQSIFQNSQSTPLEQITALKGALMRADATVNEMVTAMSKQSLSAQAKFALAQVMALSGAAEFYAYLKQYAQNEPQQALHLLALSGSPTMVPVLLTALQSIHTNQIAAQAWFYLTGYTLARKAQLTIVSEDKLATHSTQTIPDVEDAQQWWQEQQARWQEQRYLFGYAINAATLETILHQYAGTWLENARILQKFHASRAE